MIGRLQPWLRDWFQAWELRRKPFSVALVGLESGLQTVPLSWNRFKTYEDAAVWVLMRELNPHPCAQLSRWVVVDLRQVGQLDQGPVPGAQ